jgi:hypothetical protein
VWCIAVGLSVLLDRSDTPVFPRWSGYLSIATGIGFTTGSGVWFAQHGAMSWVGVLGLYEPFIIFGVWIVVFTWLSYMNIKRGYVHDQELTATT